MKRAVACILLLLVVSACGDSSGYGNPDGWDKFMERHGADAYIVNHTVTNPQAPSQALLDASWADVKTHWLGGPRFSDLALWGVVNYWPTPEESASKAAGYPGYWGAGRCKAFAMFMYFYLSEQGIQSRLGLKIDPDIGGHVVVIVEDTWTIDEYGVHAYAPGDDWRWVMRSTWFSDGWLVPVYR